MNAAWLQSTTLQTQVNGNRKQFFLKLEAIAIRLEAIVGRRQQRLFSRPPMPWAAIPSWRSCTLDPCRLSRCFSTDQHRKLFQLERMISFNSLSDFIFFSCFLPSIESFPDYRYCLYRPRIRHPRQDPQQWRDRADNQPADSGAHGELLAWEVQAMMAITFHFEFDDNLVEHENAFLST